MEVDAVGENRTGYPSIDKPWIRYYKEELLNLPLSKNTIYGYIFEKNKGNMSNRAIKYFGHDITFKTFFENVDKCTRSLLHKGIKRGDCVNILSAGIPETVYLVLACSRIGAIANFINPLFEHEQMIDRINDTLSDWIFIMDQMYPYAQEILSKTCSKKVVIIPVYESFPSFLRFAAGFKALNKKLSSKNNGISFISWKDFIHEGGSYTKPLPNEYEEDAPAIMVYSSGSTGSSKGILHTNDSINATVQDSTSQGLHYENGMTFLQMIPIWFSTGIVQSILLPLSNGVEVILEPRFNHIVFAKDVMKYHPVVTLVATSIWMAAIKNDDFQNVDLSNMRLPFTGGEKLIPSSENEINSFLKKHKCPSSIKKGYGMCELGGKVTDSVLANKPGSVGIPMAHIVVGIFDPITDNELSYGTHGEIRVDTPAHMKEYYKNKKASEEYFWKDDKGTLWGCTGDIGYIDEDGLLYVLGRATDSCTLESGEKIYLFDIEEEIIKDEAVNQCKVIDVHKNNKTSLVAHIVLREDISNSDEVIRRIFNHLSDGSIPDYMIPHYFKIRNSMPVHNNGKRDVESLRTDISDLVEL